MKTGLKIGGTLPNGEEAESTSGRATLVRRQGRAHMARRELCQKSERQAQIWMLSRRQENLRKGGVRSERGWLAPFYFVESSFHCFDHLRISFKYFFFLLQQHSGISPKFAKYNFKWLQFDIRTMRQHDLTDGDEALWLVSLSTPDGPMVPLHSPYCIRIHM